MINRISFNKCRYIVGTYDECLLYCQIHKINPKWIRYKNKKYYLRLWNFYKNK